MNMREHVCEECSRSFTPDNPLTKCFFLYSYRNDIGRYNCFCKCCVHNHRSEWFLTESEANAALVCRVLESATPPFFTGNDPALFGKTIQP